MIGGLAPGVMQLVVLGRDGVINALPQAGFVRGPEEWQAIPGSLRAIARLNHARRHVAVITHQPALGAGRLTLDALLRIHIRMQRELDAEGGQVDALLYCPHPEDVSCECRKPQPGLLQELGQRLGADLRQAVVIGDTLADIEAARAVGARPVLVRSGRGEHTLAALRGDPRLKGVTATADLAAAVAWLLNDPSGTSAAGSPAGGSRATGRGKKAEHGS